MRVAWLALSALGPAAAACDPHIVVGADPPSDAGIDAAPLVPLVVPWSSGFENGPFEWGPGLQGAGYCYGGPAMFSIVRAPVHSGQFAAAFTVDTSAPGVASHTRCVRQGVLPAAAYYGAWYYIPVQATNRGGTWNLLHFRGNNVADPMTAHGLWDVSLVNEPNGTLDNSVLDQLTSQTFDAGPPPIPIGQWFHLEVLLQPAADAGGRFALWRDGLPLVDVSGIATDDALWGQWFVGNYATALALSPAISTVYVDDVTISLTRIGP